MNTIKFTDNDGDNIMFIESEDYLCYITTGNGDLFGVSPLHANKIIETLQKILKDNS